MKGRIFSLIFACAVLLSAANVWGGGCDMTGTWLDGFNYQWVLAQDEDANIAGTVNPPFCQPLWDVDGSIDGNSFGLNATCPCDPLCVNPLAPCQNFTYTGTLVGDCNSGGGTWRNCMVGDGTFTIRRTNAGAYEIEFQVNGDGPAPGAAAQSFEQ